MSFDSVLDAITEDGISINTPDGRTISYGRDDKTGQIVINAGVPDYKVPATTQSTPATLPPNKTAFLIAAGIVGAIALVILGGRLRR